MKRTAMPARTTPLSRGTVPLQRKTRLTPRAAPSRSSPAPSAPIPSRMDVDATPPRRAAQKAPRPTVSRQEREAKRIVKARSGGWCETGCGRPAQSWSHRVARSQGGPWSPVNGLGMCSLGSGDPGCHTWTGRRTALACAGGWRLRSWQDPAAEPVWLAPACPPLPAGWYLLLPDGGLDAVTLDRPRPVMPWEMP